MEVLQMDEMVLATQKKVNSLGAGVAGFTTAPENGQTGWPTIYALIQVLQNQLGISPVSEVFGPLTTSEYDNQVTPNLQAGWNDDIVYLIQGAFWAKGINPGALDGQYSDDTINAVKQLQNNAGFTNPDGVLSAEWAKALFDMSAFVLVENGDDHIRTIQQYLNVHYSDITGILPTDGIYQRATNTALIYAMQVELGLSDIANGVWGPTTRATYADAYASGLSSNLIKLLQFALYVNMAQYIAANNYTMVPFTGVLDANTKLLLTTFQRFMKLEPVTIGQPDPITMYSLMVSSGSPNRYFWGVDTSIQLTQAMINSLVAWEVDYVGRYLTGTVGNDGTPKNLTRLEAKLIIDANLHLVPIYQDNYPELEYFTRLQGQKDARAAMRAASGLGLPAGTVIYFAIDMDMTDDDITSYAIPYFNGIASILNYGVEGNYYVPGVYGTRNVGTRLALESHSVYSYVSNMSSGYSGNLGFSQPLNWTFDQFAEDASGASGVAAIDYVNVSHEDEGVTSLIEPNQLSWIYDTDFTLLKNEYISGTLTWDGPAVTLYDNKIMKLTAQ
jgi:peptidoglycan hydrolase-like protein with peptidoglycan-binding domain